VLSKLLKFLMIVLLALMAGSFFLEDRLLVERSIEIKKPPTLVFQLLNSFENYTEWSPWHDQGIQYQTGGPGRGLGATLSWQSASRGDGVLEIVESVATEKITIRMDFADRGTAYSRFLLQPTSAGTVLRWQYEFDLSEINNPVYRYAGRYMVLLMGKWVGEDYDLGLEKIRRLAESEIS
jgi:hypothetical protein